MSRALTAHAFLFAALVVIGGLTTPLVSYGQDTPLIHACVDAKGGLRIVAPATACSAKETRLTWPAEPSASVTFYQRTSPTQPVAEGFATAIVLCDDPDDVATGGGFRLDGVPISDSTSGVLTSTSCTASGLCGGATGPDGWVVVAKSSNVAAQGTRITAYVICAQP